MGSIIPETITTAWVANLVVAFIVGLIAGRLLRVAVWLTVLLAVVFILLQFVVVTPTLNLRAFFESEQLAEMGKNAAEYIRGIVPHFGEHLRANTTLFIALVLGLAVSFFRRKS